MTEKELIQLFKDEKALLTGHFLLSSGLHSPNYMQCALVLQKPWIAEKLCQELAKKLTKYEAVTVIGPALGGMLVSYELGRALKVRSIFAERQDQAFTLRRGFSVKKGEKVIAVEDVITTGKSVHEVIELVEREGAQVVAVASLVDRSAGAAIFQQDFVSLLPMNIKTYKPNECPLCREGKLPAVKPGSRKLAVLAALFVLLLAPASNAMGNSQNQDTTTQSNAAVDQAKQDYRNYISKLKELSKEYGAVTSQIKQVIKEEGIPTFDEQTGELKMTHDLNFSAAAAPTQFSNTGPFRVSETDTEIKVVLEVPGLKKNSIRVNIENERVLRVEAVRKAMDTGGKEEPVEQSFQLPSPVQDKNTSARYEDGVLGITLKKMPVTKKIVPVTVQ